MTNEEIDIRMKALGEATWRREKILSDQGIQKRDIELELLNMSMVGIYVMLAEIAKRLPDRGDKKS
jgi:hypothetical protein